MSRRKGRIIAFQALYSWDVSQSSLEDLLTFSWLEKDSEIKARNLEEEGESQPLTLSEGEIEERTFASLIIRGTIDHCEEIDDEISNHLAASWKIDRVNKVALAILRVSVYELKFQKQVDANVVIDEAVNIAKSFGPDDSYKFINAVLDKIGKDEEKK